jgi:hypothetical protein
MANQAHRARRLLVTVTALAGLLPALIVIGPPAGAASVTLCGKGQHITVQSWGGVRFTVRNDWFLKPGCLVNQNAQANFQVSTGYAPDPSGKVVSYPDIFRGCSWGVCSPGARLPAQVSALGAPSVSWRTTESARGRWNAAFDIWFSKHFMTTGQAEGAELMIWLQIHKLASAKGAPIVLVGHNRYYLLHWIAKRGAASWNYIQFRRVRPTTEVSRLSLRPFIQRAEKHGWIKPTWWMDNVETGYEIWYGGKGLATSRFWAKP